MVFQSTHCFSNDGQLQPDEFKALRNIALCEGGVDENEKKR